MQFENEGVVGGASPLSRRNEHIIISCRGESATLAPIPIVPVGAPQSCMCESSNRHVTVDARMEDLVYLDRGFVYQEQKTQRGKAERLW
ncbi:hypothetical protein E2C01_085116 [Portunus trituberculatus]|uniref:Uncharacterized protein n=1 Tax=Portunus trituberculatus TaxID=210409 RepID=A0A5B7JCP4_PORTR|nr:hypothetical protein [Portunus trituberculatus]